MIDLLGFAALGLALVAMTSRRMKTLRWLHLASCGLYASYGVLVAAPPVAVGAVLFGAIHVYHLRRLHSAPKQGQEGRTRWTSSATPR